MGGFKIGYERGYEHVKKLFFFQINRKIFSRKKRRRWEVWGKGLNNKNVRVGLKKFSELQIDI